MYGPGNDNYGRDKLDLTVANKKLDRLKKLVESGFTQSEMNQAKRELLDEVEAGLDAANEHYDFDYCSGNAIKQHISNVISLMKKDYES